MAPYSSDDDPDSGGVTAEDPISGDVRVQMQHRFDMDRKRLAADIENKKEELSINRYIVEQSFRVQRRGQWFGFGIGITALIIGVGGMVFGQSAWVQGFSALFGVGGVAGLISVFLYQQKQPTPPH